MVLSSGVSGLISKLSSQSDLHKTYCLLKSLHATALSFPDQMLSPAERTEVISLSLRETQAATEGGESPQAARDKRAIHRSQASERPGPRV